MFPPPTHTPLGKKTTKEIFAFPSKSSIWFLKGRATLFILDLFYTAVYFLWITGFFRELFGDAHSEYMKAASNLRDHYRFGHVSDEDLIKKYEPDGE